MNIFNYFHDQVITVLKSLGTKGVLPPDLDFSRITVDPPKERSHGDLTTNAAMILAKPVGKNPRELAELIAEELRNLPHIESVAIAGPGFINLTLHPSIWQAQLKDILKSGVAYGDSSLGQDQPINVEYVSVNPTGPMHAGHGRNAVLGDVIAVLLEKIGYKVCREYYINDAGGQIDHLARSVYLRYCQALGQTIKPEDFKDGMYPGDYLMPLGEALAKQYGKQWQGTEESVWLKDIRKYSAQAMMDIIRDDLKAIGVEHTLFISESDLVAAGKVEEVLQYLEKKGDLYVGVLEPPKGHVVEDWEPRPQTLFRATQYGDDVDRPLRKSDGSWTYFTTDIAYHVDKFRRGFSYMIDILGSDHIGYFKRIQAAVKAATDDQAHLEVKACQMVNFLDKGVPVRMSKRAGTFITLRDVINSVGKDATRFIMVSRRHDVEIDFDFAKVMEQSRDNPVFYVQYAHARACSVLRHSGSLFKGESLEVDSLQKASLDLLKDKGELEMIKVLAEWPRQVEVAALTREPHRIANYLYELASSFHALWNKGKDNTDLRFILADNPSLTLARLALVKALTLVVASGLRVFGITPVEEMH